MRRTGFHRYVIATIVAAFAFLAAGNIAGAQYFGSPMVPSPAPAPAAKSKLQIVATGGHVLGEYTPGGGNTITCFESRLQKTSAPVFVHDIRFIYPAFYAQVNVGDTAAQNDLTVGGAVELASPVFNSRSFLGGNATKLISAGVSYFITDPPGIDLTAGTTFFIRTDVTASAGQFVPYGFQQLRSGDGFVETAVAAASCNQATATGALTVNGGSFVSHGYGPLATLGYPQTPTPAAIIRGNSTCYGQGDTNVQAFGYIERGLIATTVGPTPYMNLARSGDTLLDNGSSLEAISRNSLMDFGTHVFSCLGDNDPAAGQTLAQMQANVIFLANAWRARGLKVWWCTLLPRTTSTTNNWTTPATQVVTPGYESTGIRGQFNTWLFTQIGVTIDGVYNTNIVAEDSANPGKWANVSGAALTGDGTHLDPLGHSLEAPGVTAIANGWTVNYLLKRDIDPASNDNDPMWSEKAA